MSVDLDEVRRELGYFTTMLYEHPDWHLDSAKPLLSLALDLYAALREREAATPLSETAA